MKPLNWTRLIKIWGMRVIMIALLVFTVNRWGVPLYKQYFASKKTSVFIPSAKVRSGSFIVSFHEIGALEAERSTPVISDVGGKIIYLVNDGSLVTAGQRIVELDTEEAMREIRREQLSYRNALAEVDRAKAEQTILQETNKTDIKKQQAIQDFNQNELAIAKANETKKKKLAADKVIPLSEAESASSVVRSKELEVQKGDMDLELKKKDVASKESQKAAEVKKVEFAADIQKSTLEEVQNRLKSAVMISPATGLVVVVKDHFSDGRRQLQAGDTIRPRQAICTIPDLSSMLVKLEVGEADAPRIKLGIPVVIRLEAVPKKVFHGTVTEISNLATESSPWDSGSTPGRKNFEVVIAVKEVDPKTLKPGMTADVEFICDTVKNTISVPLECVIEQDGKTFVYVKDGKRYERRVVKTGKHNDNFVCITKGLLKSDVVALRDPTKPLDMQQAGSSAPGAEQDKTKAGAAPIPETAKKK